jgi:hypothetical protein
MYIMYCQIPLFLAQAYPDFCDFDNTYMCNWSPQSNYGVWSRTSGSTETAKTGPVFDHTRETSDGKNKTFLSCIYPFVLKR